ncbi:MAG: hypothetical protein AAGF20_05835 [Pseudomonadota bacterium]
MFDRSDLRAAITAGVLSAEQAARLEAFLASRKSGQEQVQAGTENLRFLANFNDIFITLGLVILFTGVIAGLSMMATPDVVGGRFSSAIAATAAIAGLAWAMMEYFCARRRLLLPSMFLSLVFVGFACLTLVAIFVQSIDLSDVDNPLDLFQRTGRAGVAVFALALVSALLIFWRFRLPFALALAAFAAAGAVYVGFSFEGRMAYVVEGGMPILMGLVTLGVAIWFDMQDPQRLYKASDNAFWLHLAAAPQLIMGVSTLVTGSNLLAGSTSGATNALQGITLLVALFVIGLISLALNRRALIAASLLTFIWALSFVLNKAGLNVSTIFMVVTILIGTGVVLLGAGWKTARRLVLAVFPKGHTWSKLFPPEPVG